MRSKPVLSLQRCRACSGFPWPHRDQSERAAGTRAGQLFQAAFSNRDHPVFLPSLPKVRKTVSVAVAGRQQPVRLSLFPQLPPKVCLVCDPGSSAHLALRLLKSPFTQG